MALRVCDVCGVVDENPRHVFALAENEAPAPRQSVVETVLNDTTLSADVKAAVLGDLYDTTLEIRHVSCCAAAGCPTCAGA